VVEGDDLNLAHKDDTEDSWKEFYKESVNETIKVLIILGCTVVMMVLCSLAYFIAEKLNIHIPRWLEMLHEWCVLIPLAAIPVVFTLIEIKHILTVLSPNWAKKHFAKKSAKRNLPPGPGTTSSKTQIPAASRRAVLPKRPAGGKSKRRSRFASIIGRAALVPSIKCLVNMARCVQCAGIGDGAIR